MNDYDWRQHWQTTLRGGYSVCEVFQLSEPLVKGETLLGVIEINKERYVSTWYSTGLRSPVTICSDEDLMPIVKPQTYRPFRPDEAANLITRIVKHVVLGDLAAIYGYSKLRNTYYTAVGGGATAEELLACYVFADGREDDGKPVGVPE